MGANKKKPTKPQGSVEVEVTRVEQYACGCTTTRIESSQLARKWLQHCSAHQGRLVKVETVMEFQLEAETPRPAAAQAA